MPVDTRIFHGHPAQALEKEPGYHHAIGGSGWRAAAARDFG
jgi:hypothetical protein